MNSDGKLSSKKDRILLATNKTQTKNLSNLTPATCSCMKPIVLQERQTENKAKSKKNYIKTRTGLELNNFYSSIYEHIEIVWDLGIDKYQ